MTIEAVIFDWDGLLADTEPCWSKADQIWLRNNHVDYNDEIKAQLTGRGQVDCVTALMEFGHFKIPVDEAIKQRLETLDTVYNTCENILMPGAFNLVRDFFEKGYLIGIASGSSQKTLDYLVFKQAVAGFLKVIMSSDQVENGKPAPDVYLAVAEKLKTPPNKCLVFEDAQNGLEAAKSAAMYCVAVPNQYTVNQDFSRADMILSNLSAFKVDNIDDYFS